jgi:hypothetical protein
VKRFFFLLLLGRDAENEEDTTNTLYELLHSPMPPHNVQPMRTNVLCNDLLLQHGVCQAPPFPLGLSHRQRREGCECSQAARSCLSPRDSGSTMLHSLGTITTLEGGRCDVIHSHRISSPSCDAECPLSMALAAASLSTYQVYASGRRCLAPRYPAASSAANIFCCATGASRDQVSPSGMRTAANPHVDASLQSRSLGSGHVITPHDAEHAARWSAAICCTVTDSSCDRPSQSCRLAMLRSCSTT